MTIYTQLSGTPVSGGDFALKNFGGSDIGPGLAVLLDPSNDKGVVLPTASGGVAGTIGVTVDTIKAGGTGRVRVYGSAVCTANGSITRGTPVQISDTSGKLGYVKTQLSGIQQLGIALNSASDGDPVEVLIDRANNA